MFIQYIHGTFLAHDKNIATDLIIAEESKIENKVHAVKTSYTVPYSWNVWRG